jgi:hypothetical protein
LARNGIIEMVAFVGLLLDVTGFVLLVVNLPGAGICSLAAGLALYLTAWLDR